MSARTLLTFAQFEQIPDDGMKQELLRGELIAVPPPKLRHTRAQQKLSDLLRPHVHKRHLGEIHIEAGFRLSSDTCLQPDVSFVRTAHIQRTDPDGHYEGSPAIAIEVASDSNTAAQLDLKMDEYFTHGAEEVWIVYPKTRKVSVHCPDGTSKTFSGDTALQTSALPDLSISVSSLFEG